MGRKKKKREKSKLRSLDSFISFIILAGIIAVICLNGEKLFNKEANKTIAASANIVSASSNSINNEKEDQNTRKNVVEQEKNDETHEELNETNEEENNVNDSSIETEENMEENLQVNISSNNKKIDLSKIPDYSEKAYIIINDNKPYFDESDYTTEAFETYSELDELGRCGVAFANVCKEIMPADGEKRESISNVKPTGWVQGRYNGEYLYNRCHLIGYQLAAENANELNLITGTRYFNVTGMLPFENEVANYIYKHNNNHVLYRVTPIFIEDNLLSLGVEMEAYSIEDDGSGVCFNVFVYNVQPGIVINYATGENWE